MPVFYYSLLLTFLIGVAACDSKPKPENNALSMPVVQQPNEQSPHSLIAQAKPSLSFNAKSELLISKNMSLQAKIVDQSYGWTEALTYGADGTLYFLTVDEQEDVSPNWLGKIPPEKNSVLRLGRARAVGSQYLKLTGLAIYDTKLVTLEYDLLPIQCDLNIAEDSDQFDFIPYIHPSGEMINGFFEYDKSPYVEYGVWSIKYLKTDGVGHIVWYNEGIKQWQQFMPSKAIKNIDNLAELPIEAYLLTNRPWTDIESAVPGKDGYIYALKISDTEASQLIRIGDAGKNSLSKDATRTVIHEYPAGKLTGAMAISSSGTIAIGGDDGIYLVTPD